MNTREIKILCENPETREKGLTALAEWAKNICLFFGVTVSVAYASYQEDDRGY